MSTASEDYLKAREGDVHLFHRELTMGEELGTAFFRALSLKDQRRLEHNEFNTWGATRGYQLHRAIEYLLDTEK